jgi:hypothetical protein
MALPQTFCNHYRRAAPNVNIFKFFHYRTVLLVVLTRRVEGPNWGPRRPRHRFRGRSEKWGCRRKMPRSGRIWSILRNSPKTGMESLPMGPSPPPRARTVALVRCTVGIFLTRIRFYPNQVNPITRIRYTLSSNRAYTVPLIESKLRDFGSLYIGKYNTFVCGTLFPRIKQIELYPRKQSSTYKSMRV